MTSTSLVEAGIPDAVVSTTAYDAIAQELIGFGCSSPFIVGSLRDREVAGFTSDCQDSDFGGGL